MIIEHCNHRLGKNIELDEEKCGRITISHLILYNQLIILLFMKNVSWYLWAEFTISSSVFPWGFVNTSALTQI